MKLTVLQQQNKAFIEENPEGGKQVAKTLERVKHSLWHGNVDKALECLGLLLFDLDVQRLERLGYTVNLQPVAA